MQYKKLEGASVIELFIGLSGAVIVSLMLCQLVMRVMQYITFGCQQQGELEALLVVDSLKRDLMSATPHQLLIQKGIVCTHRLDKKGEPQEVFIMWGSNELGVFRKEGDFDMKVGRFHARSTIMMRCPITALSIEPNYQRPGFFDINYKIKDAQYQTKAFTFNKLF